MILYKITAWKIIHDQFSLKIYIIELMARINKVNMNECVE